jgi:hypothetical protein
LQGADFTDDEVQQRRTLLSGAPFRGLGECGSIATTEPDLGDVSVDTRCACREAAVEDDTTQSATN